MILVPFVNVLAVQVFTVNMKKNRGYIKGLIQSLMILLLVPNTAHRESCMSWYMYQVVATNMQVPCKPVMIRVASEA